MSKLNYLDIHTHGRSPHEEAVSVYSLSAKELSSEWTGPQYSSGGIHPWWLEDYSKEEISQLKANIENLVQDKKLWAIGETGLDRAYPEFLEEQKELFNWHLKLSEENHLPLIIHSVRAGADFLQILKEHKPESPWIFHDYRGNEQLMRDILRLHPKAYFSFGMSIDNSPQTRELLPLVPIENLFLETDEQKHLDIHDIFVRASHHMTVDVEFLKSQIWHNFKKISCLN